MCVLTTASSIGAVWVSLSTTQRNWSRLGAGAVFGLAVGVIHLIEAKIEGKSALKRGLGGFVGLITGCSFALLLYPETGNYFVFGIGGIVLGATARDWAYHVNFF